MDRHRFKGFEIFMKMKETIVKIRPNNVLKQFWKNPGVT